VADEGFLLIQPIKQPLQVLERVLLPAAAELGVVLGDQDLEIEGFQTLLVLLLDLDIVYNQRFVEFFGVDARVESPEDFAELAVEAVARYLLAGLEVELSVFEVLELDLGEGVEHLEY